MNLIFSSYAFSYQCKYEQRLNPLSANPEKWSNTLKQIVGNLPTICVSVFGHFMNLALKGLITAKQKAPRVKVTRNFGKPKLVGKNNVLNPFFTFGHLHKDTHIEIVLSFRLCGTRMVQSPSVCDILLTLSIITS